VVDAYEQYRQEQRLPVSYEVLYGNAWAVEGSGQSCQTPQPIKVSFPG
jgi:hypothetical protein